MPDVIVREGCFHRKKILWKFWYIPEHAMSRVVPYFPRPQDFRGHYSEKCGNGPELLNNARWERVRPDIVRLRRPKAGGDVVWDAVTTGREMSSPRNLRDDDEEIYREEKRKLFIRAHP